MPLPDDSASPPPDPAANPLGPDATSKGRIGAAAAVTFTATFAFLLASFPAQNPDLWAHLAAGRDLATGHFAAATADWTAESPTISGWLYNLGAYALYSVVGGAALVFTKAVLVAALALILLRLSRTRPGWLVPAFCTGLALLAMSPGLRLQPVTVSYLFLAVTLWLVRDDETSRRSGARAVVPLVVLFLAWANMDRWFVLGLGAVALTWFGQALDRPQGRVRFALGRAGSLALLVTACVLNPAHVSAFLFVRSRPAGPAPSPFGLLNADVLERSPAELAYFPLLVFGLLSFALALPKWRWARFLPWAGLAALSALQSRAVPFFAVVAGPVLAWNLQDFFARRAGPGRVSARLRWAVPALAGLLGLIFLACAWAGWLRTPPFEPRRWAVETPPALERGAEAVARWHAEGRFGANARGLHLSPETAFAFSWFCPEDKPVRDPALTAELLSGPDGGRDGLRAAGVDHLIIYDADRARLSDILRRLFADPDQFPLLLWQGDLAVFGWRDPAAGTAADPRRGVRPDFDRLALHPGPGEKAPATRPTGDPEPRRWWEALWEPVPPRPIDRDVAVLHVLQADAVRDSAQARHEAAWHVTQLAGLVGSAAAGGGATGCLDMSTRLNLIRPPERVAMVLHPAFVLARDDAPMAVLYLAVRAARRALAVNPQDAVALATLGEAYRQLHYGTRERAWGRQLPELAQLRRVQAVVALRQAVTLNPGLDQAQFSLGNLYQESGYLDLALKHWRAGAAAARKAPPPPGMDPVQYRERVAEVERQVGRLADVVAERERQYLRDAADLRVLDRAARARDLGLVGRAMDVLLNSDISAFGAAGMHLELELLLRTGRVREVREWTDPEHQEAL
ncbi:MAG: hypothetical protein J2P46_13020, partial [Zavarzinella sp.]|nr:hypothetical protein [Zavarzinella sp.]